MLHHRVLCLLSCTESSVFMSSFFFFNDTATTEIYTLSLHDALPISSFDPAKDFTYIIHLTGYTFGVVVRSDRSEEHTSELQSRSDLVCRLLLEKKKKQSQQ